MSNHMDAHMFNAQHEVTSGINHRNIEWSHGVVVITSALHAEGREFDPRCDLNFFFHYYTILRHCFPFRLFDRKKYNAQHEYYSLRNQNKRKVRNQKLCFFHIGFDNIELSEARALRTEQR